MTTASPFQTKVRNPGQGRQCRVIRHDPFPGGIPDYDPVSNPPPGGDLLSGDHRNVFKVTVSLADVWGFLWNLEEWSVDVEAAVNVDSGDCEFAATASGQWHYLDARLAEDFSGTGNEGHNVLAKVLQGEPRQRVCGACFETLDRDVEDYNGDPPSITHSADTENVLLPFCRLSAYDVDNGGASKTVSGDIEDGSSNVKGDYSVTRSVAEHVYDSSFYWGAKIEFLYVRITSPTTCDVYFDARLYAGIFIGSVDDNTTSAVLSNNNTYDPVQNILYPSPTPEAVTFTVLGQSVSAYIWHRGNLGASSSLTSFTLTYAITPTTVYSY